MISETSSNFLAIYCLLLIFGDCSLRALTVPEEDALVAFLDSSRPGLKIAIKNLSSLLSALIEDQYLPDRTLKLEVLSEGQIGSGELETRTLKDLLEYTDDVEPSTEAAEIVDDTAALAARSRGSRQESTPIGFFSGASLHQGQLASETDVLSTVPRDTLDKWIRIADGETLTQLWLCLYAQRQTASTSEPEDTLESPDPSDTSIEGQLRKYQLQYQRGTTKHKQLAKIPWRLYLANIAGLYQREQAAREAVNKRRKRYRGRNVDTTKISRKSVFDSFVDFHLPELRQQDTDTYETAKTRFEKWMQHGKRWATLVDRFSAGILLLMPQDLSDNK